MHYAYLMIAIVCEVAATSALKASNGFTQLLPSGVVVVGYGAAFYFLGLVLQRMSVGVAYAIWAGVGVVLVGLVGRVVYDQRLDLAAITGMALIIAGVAVINLWSSTQIQ
jgi:small multidrug resistance pump